jgi:hypothetical protein
MNKPEVAETSDMLAEPVVCASSAGYDGETIKVQRKVWKDDIGLHEKRQPCQVL